MHTTIPSGSSNPACVTAIDQFLGLSGACPSYSTSYSSPARQKAARGAAFQHMVWLTEPYHLHDILFKLPPLNMVVPDRPSLEHRFKGYAIVDWLWVQPRRIPTPSEHHTASRILPTRVPSQTPKFKFLLQFQGTRIAGKRDRVRANVSGIVWCILGTGNHLTS
jgi:hypothetical protein